jgi:CHAD domain-containing protein
MQPLQQQAWTLPEHCTPIDFHTALVESFEVKSGAVKKLRRSWFDTFDWRLFRKNRLLVREGMQWCLLDFEGHLLQSLISRGKEFRYSWQFPDSPLRDALTPCLDVRALMELGSEDVVSTELCVLNRDKKIVAYLELQLATDLSTGQQMLSVQLREVRGYVKKFKQVAAFIGQFGGREQATPADALRFVLQSSDRFPLDYSSGYDVPLDPQMSSLEAVGCIYRFLLTAMQKNVQGVIEDRDSEYLHDLRVAVRRTRSGLALIKEVLASEVSNRFKKEFRYIGQITGPVRDLDVYLLCEDAYKARLPSRLQKGLGYFFEDIAANRRLEQKKLVRNLRAPRYGGILADWEQVLGVETDAVAGKNAEVPIGTLAGKIIHKRFRRVLRDGKKIHSETQDRELHRLRIECKKLRYSLEFFASLYDPQQMKQLIGQLKKLQNNLGDFNDLSVQQEMLANYLSHVRPGSRKSIELSASIGGLMTDLCRQHRQVRAHFEETFVHFSCRENLALYHDIFG